MTYSVGFRAPNAYEFTRDYLDSIHDLEDDRVRFSDPSRLPTPNPGEITTEDIRRFRELILLPSDEVQFARWLGQYLTRSAELPAVEVERKGRREKLQNGEIWRRSDDITFAFSRIGEKLSVFIGGTLIDVPQEAHGIAVEICNKRNFQLNSLNEVQINFLATLMDEGWIYPC